MVTGSASRRGLMLGLASLPLTGMAPPAMAVSDLALACQRAVAHIGWVDATCPVEMWNDERLDAEMDKHAAVFWRAIEEPSASLGDLAAKASLLLEDFDRHSPDDGTRDTQERLIAVILNEIIALVPASGL